MKIILKSALKPKERKCLMCGKPFESEWVGERVCRKCKSSSSWRDGRNFSSYPWAP